MSPSLSAGYVRAFALLLAVVFTGCKESTASREPKSLAQGDVPVAEGVAGTALATAPTFVVKDEAGDPIGGVSITVAVTAGGGTLTGAPTRSSDGPTSPGVWKLGNVAGLNTITVTVAGLTPLVISVTGKAGPPASLAFVAGSTQSAAAGTAVSVTPVAQVRDQFGNGVSGMPVSFSVVEGEGSIASLAPVTTDASGNASSPQWTLGKFAIPQSLRASTTGNIAAVANATIATSYNVEVRFFGPPMPANTSAMFTAAAARIKGAVTGDVFDFLGRTPGLNLESQVEGCGVAGLPINFTEAIDDLMIFASVGTIDGPGNVLAFSFPCFIRQPAPNIQTLIGIMKFDSDDLENMIARGNLTDVIQHEMLHIVGLGTLWDDFGLLAGRGTPQSRYTGTLGINGCIAIGGTNLCASSVPVEIHGGPGTADSHWSDEVFFNELMTGFVNTRNSVPTGILNPLSVMTIQSLGDLGYVVNAKAADPYTIPGTSAARIFGQLNVDNATPQWETMQRPRFQISRSGKISPVAKQ
jgi:hypothetical protein